MVEHLAGCADLLNAAFVEDHDAAGQRHGLDLIVGYIQRGFGQALVQQGQLCPHVPPEFGVQVGQGLIKQKDLWFTHDGAANGHALALATGQFLRSTLEQVFNVEDLGRRGHFGVDV